MAEQGVELKEGDNGHLNSGSEGVDAIGDVGFGPVFRVPEESYMVEKRQQEALVKYQENRNPVVAPGIFFTRIMSRCLVRETSRGRYGPT